MGARTACYNGMILTYLCGIMWVILFMATRCTAAYTDTECKESCGADSIPSAGYGRTLGNKVNGDFTGAVDVWCSRNTRLWTTNVVCWSGQAWPRISEGIVVPSTRTPGYPIRVNKYIALGERYISYKGRWTIRNHGPGAYIRRNPKGPRYNGAYIWLNNAWNYHDYPGSKLFPKWPFPVEINIWNRHDLGADAVPSFRDYHDANGRYAVSGGLVRRGSVSFFAYFILNKSNEGMADMHVNTVKLLKHLRDHCGLSGRLEIIEIAVAVEGHGGADGKFVANIHSMGRP